MFDFSSEERARHGLGRLMLIARWIMIPFYLGLLAALVLVAVKFVQKLVQAVPEVLQQDSNETLYAMLTLVDLSLVGNLIVIVIFAGWHNYVGRFIPTSPGERPNPFTSLGFGAVKMRIIGSIIVIASILMLETFVHLDGISIQHAAWQLAILLGLSVAGVLLAVMDRLGGHE